MIKRIKSHLIHLLEAYSPLALLVIALPFFLPIEQNLQRILLLSFCALPAGMLTLLRPGAVFKKPGLLLIMLFVAYFSTQHIRGMLPVTTSLLVSSARQALLIIGPVILLSFATPDRKLYPVVIRLVLLAITFRIGYEMFHFYSKAPFPLARFEGMGQPVNGSQIAGFFAVLAGTLFLQTGPGRKRWDWFALACMPLLLAAAFYTHTRSTALALLITSAGAILCIRNRTKKVLILYAAIAATFFVYAGSSLLAPKPPERVKRPKPATQLAKAPSNEAVSLSQEHKKKPRKRKYATREGGLLTTSQGGKICASARLYIWQDHLSRMDTAKRWLIGHGLGMNVFIEESEIYSSEAARWYRADQNGRIPLHAHSGYVWALYHGGIIGLGILLALLGAAGWPALRAGADGIVPLALLIFASTCFLMNGQRLLGAYGPHALLFWVPLGLAAGFPFRKR